MKWANDKSEYIQDESDLFDKRQTLTNFIRFIIFNCYPATDEG